MLGEDQYPSSATVDNREAICKGVSMTPLWPRQAFPKAGSPESISTRLSFCCPFMPITCLSFTCRASTYCSKRDLPNRNPSLIKVGLQELAKACSKLSSPWPSFFQQLIAS